jgi:hypothetical protein
MKRAIEMLKATAAFKSPRKDTPSGVMIMKRAKGCTLVGFMVQVDYDMHNRPHAHCVGKVVCPPPNGSGQGHQVEARLYAPWGTAQSPTYLACDCGNFRYTWEVALQEHKSSSNRCSDGSQPTKRNPSKVPALCKHLVRFLQYATKSRKVQKAASEIPTEEIKRSKKRMNLRVLPKRVPKRGFCPKEKPKGKKKRSTPKRPTIRGRSRRAK